MPNRPVRSPLRRRLAAVGAASVLLGAAPAAADAAAWIDGPQFDVAFPASTVDFAAAPDGSATAAWLEIDTGSNDVVAAAFQHASPDGALGPVVELGHPDEEAHALDVATGASGATAVAWTSDDGSGDAAVTVTLLRPDGSVVATVPVGDILQQGTPVVAVDGEGDALVAWVGYDADAGVDVAKAVRVAADGTLGSTVALGPSDDEQVQVAVTPAGTGWVLWHDGGDQQIARLAANGEIDGAAGIPAAGPTLFPSLVAGENGAALARLELVGGSAHIDGVRLPVQDEIAGTPFQAAEVAQVGLPILSTRPAVAPDGTVTVAWTAGDFTRPDAVGTVEFSRFAPGAETAAAQTLPSSGAPLGDMLPVLATRPDGGTLAAWVAARRAFSLPLQAGTIGADGLPGAPLAAGASLSTMMLSGGGVLDRLVLPYPTADGGALLGVVDGIVLGGSAGVVSLTTRRLDAAPPQLTAQLPATAVAGQPVAFSANAADALSGASIWWDFGDASGSRSAAVNHVYALPGTYSVSVTATDAAGNATTQTRALTVTAPPAPPLPLPRDQARTAAGLKLTSAVRSGATVKVTGTIAAGATGRVTLAYAQKSGRRTLTARTSATIAKGRFAATFRLSRALAKRFRLKPVVTAAYAGDSATDAATVKRTVTVRAASRARRGGRRSGRRGAKKR